MKIEKNDRDLGRQIRDAASSVALNSAEGAFGRKGHRDERMSTAFCSAKEVLAGLGVAVAWDYVSAEETAVARDRMDHTAASLYRLMHPAR